MFGEKPKFVSIVDLIDNIDRNNTPVTKVIHKKGVGAIPVVNIEKKQPPQSSIPINTIQDIKKSTRIEPVNSSVKVLTVKGDDIPWML